MSLIGCLEGNSIRNKINLTEKESFQLNITFIPSNLLSMTTKRNFIHFYIGHQTGKCCKILYVVRRTGHSANTESSIGVILGTAYNYYRQLYLSP